MRLTSLAVPVVLAAALAACHHNPPQVAVTPSADSAALAERQRADSIARADAEARAREDSIRLALGNRRAISAKTYLVSHGVAAGRIETVSYGEERPLDPRHNETAWALHRNDQFTILTPAVVLRMP